MASTKIVVNKEKNFDENERIFLICDKCLWNVTCLSVLCKQKVLEISNFCPVCKCDRLSRFPLTNSNSNDFQSSINTNHKYYD